MENINLVIGQPYLVKHFGGQKKVRRIYKGEETGVLNIKRYVFSGKVSKDVKCEVTYSKSGAIKFFQWRGTSKVPAQEVSIPYYDLKVVEPVS